MNDNPILENRGENTFDPEIQPLFWDDTPRIKIIAIGDSGCEIVKPIAEHRLWFGEVEFFHVDPTQADTLYRIENTVKKVSKAGIPLPDVLKGADLIVIAMDLGNSMNARRVYDIARAAKSMKVFTVVIELTLRIHVTLTDSTVQCP
ncbi:hypothetical protein EVC37_00045 [Methylocaldum sp. BRCS4]|jgi:cell division GTPase FtsZ|uniref:hypothetical protein n=1 Tax=Methylocaldum sp. GT1BB TaxID=3438963 RepID=UPI000A3265CA|nr:hypothetical protein [Methylocaldum sp. BRCS4]